MIVCIKGAMCVCECERVSGRAHATFSTLQDRVSPSRHSRDHLEVPGPRWQDELQTARPRDR
jgi:hypothetical protein